MTTKQPVTISKELAETIVNLRRIYDEDACIVELHTNHEDWGAGYEIMDTVSLDYLIRILYVGYEVEKSPEEKVKALYDNYGPDSRGHHDYEDQRVQQGIRMTLKIIGMKVEGIEDDN